MMSLCLKHRVIRVMKIIKRVKHPFDCFRVIRRLLEIKNKSKYCLHANLRVLYFAVLQFVLKFAKIIVPIH